MGDTTMSKDMITVSKLDADIYGKDVTETALALMEVDNKRLLMEWDGKDFEVIRERKKIILKKRTAIEPRKLELTENARIFTKNVNSLATSIITRLKDQEKPFDDILDAEKARTEAIKQAKIEAEQRRVAIIQNRITYIRNLAMIAAGKPSPDIKLAQEELNEFMIDDKFDYEELTNDAVIAKDETFAVLTTMFRVKSEAEERDRQEAAAMEKRKREQKAEDDRLIEERRKFAEEQQAARRVQAIKDRILLISRFPVEKSPQNLPAWEIEEIITGFNYSYGDKDTFDYAEFAEEARKEKWFVVDTLNKALKDRKEFEQQQAKADADAAELAVFRQKQREERGRQAQGAGGVDAFDNYASNGGTIGVNANNNDLTEESVEEAVGRIFAQPASVALSQPVDENSLFGKLVLALINSRRFRWNIPALNSLSEIDRASVQWAHEDIGRLRAPLCCCPGEKG